MDRGKTVFNSILIPQTSSSCSPLVLVFTLICLEMRDQRVIHPDRQTDRQTVLCKSESGQHFYSFQPSVQTFPPFFKQWNSHGVHVVQPETFSVTTCSMVHIASNPQSTLKAWLLSMTSICICICSLLGFPPLYKADSPSLHGQSLTPGLAGWFLYIPFVFCL